MPTVLITGSNRGIGFGLASHYASLDDHIVITAVRTPAAVPVGQMKLGRGSSVITLQLDITDLERPEIAIDELKTQHGIRQLDTLFSEVIANAAIKEGYYTFAEAPLDLVAKHFTVNTLSSLALFQACLPLLVKGGKFVFMSSGSSLLDRIPDKKDGPYGMSKIAINHMAKYLAAENPEYVIFPLSPGWVATDMGNEGARLAGKEQAPLGIDESVAGCTEVIATANMETSGWHTRYTGERAKF